MHPRCEVSMTICMDRRGIKEKYQNGCNLETIHQNDLISTQHLARAYVHIHTNYKVSKTVYEGRRAN